MRRRTSWFSVATRSVPLPSLCLWAPSKVTLTPRCAQERGIILEICDDLKLPRPEEDTVDGNSIFRFNKKKVRAGSTNGDRRVPS
jgi:hypothetical protein